MFTRYRSNLKLILFCLPLIVWSWFNMMRNVFSFVIWVSLFYFAIRNFFAVLVERLHKTLFLSMWHLHVIEHIFPQKRENHTSQRNKKKASNGNICKGTIIPITAISALLHICASIFWFSKHEQRLRRNRNLISV